MPQSADTKQVYQEYPSRFATVATYSALCIVNAICWPVTTSVSVTLSEAYDVPQSTISLVPMMYMITYVIIGFPTNWGLDFYGLRKCVILSAILNLIGAAIRLLINQNFAYLIIGQIFLGFAQPFILSSQAKLAITWFFPQNRSLALSIIISSNIIGNAIGGFLPQMFVSSVFGNSQEIIKKQYQTVLFYEFIMALVATFLILAWFFDKPPSPPSHSVQLQKNEERVMLTELSQLFKNINFVAILLIYAVLMGIYCFYGSLLGDLLTPFGYSSNEVAIFGIVCNVCGVLLACLIGIYVQRTLNYKRCFVAFTILGLLYAVSTPLIFALTPQSRILMYFVIGLQGFLCISLSILMVDYASNILYPSSESQINGCLQIIGNLFGILMIVIPQNWLNLSHYDPSSAQSQQQAQKASVISTSFIGVLLLCSTVMLVCLIYKNNPLKRSQVDLN